MENVFFNVNFYFGLVLEYPSLPTNGKSYRYAIIGVDFVLVVWL